MSTTTRTRALTHLIVALVCLTAASPGVCADDDWSQTEHRGVEALDANRYWIAEPLLKQSLTKAGAFGMSDLRLAKSLGDMGRLYTIRGLFSQAEPYLEEELHVTQEALGKQSPDTIPTMSSLIKFYLSYGTATKADPLSEEMLSILEAKVHEPASGKMTIKKGMPLEGWAGSAALNSRDPLIEWAIACDAVGNLYRTKGNLDLAERFLKTSIDLKTTVLGKEHLSLATTYDALGSVYLDKNDYVEAESYLRDALALTEKILPSDRPEVYSRLDKLAKVLVKSGKPAEAEALYKRAQNFWKDEPCTNGDDARALYALGSLYIDQKRYEEAAPIFEKALTVAEQNDGPCSMGFVPYLQRYAYVLYYLGRKDEVLELKGRANTISGVMNQVN